MKWSKDKIIMLFLWVFIFFTMLYVLISNERNRLVIGFAFLIFIIMNLMEKKFFVMYEEDVFLFVMRKLAYVVLIGIVVLLDRTSLSQVFYLFLIGEFVIKTSILHGALFTVFNYFVYLLIGFLKVKELVIENLVSSTLGFVILYFSVYLIRLTILRIEEKNRI